jgi:hypothetical protein
VRIEDALPDLAYCGGEAVADALPLHIAIQRRDDTTEREEEIVALRIHHRCEHAKQL